MAISLAFFAVNILFALGVPSSLRPVVHTQIERGELCEGISEACASGLSCIGKEGLKRCFPKRKVDEQCGNDPFWECEDDLRCVSKLCVKPLIALGESCNLPTDICENLLSCVGNTGNKRCFKKRAINEKCGKDPFWVCEEPLDCVSDICIKAKIGEALPCNTETDECEESLTCVGNPGNKACVRTRGVGESCSKDPVILCNFDLDCLSSICVKPRVGKGLPCNDATEICEKGLRCAGPEDDKRCFIKRDVGEICEEEPFSICKYGLDCIAGVCIRSPIGKGKSCDGMDSICEKGLSCLGKKGNKKCFAKLDAGSKCGNNPFSVCKFGLDCLSNFCVKPRIGKGVSCNEVDDVCLRELSCVGRLGNKRCFEKRNEGERCGKDPFWVCKLGMDCVENICIKTEV